MPNKAKTGKEPPVRRGWFDHRPIVVSVLLGLGTVLYNSSRGIAPTVMGAFMGFMLWQTLFLAWIGGMWAASRWKLHTEERYASAVWATGLVTVGVFVGYRQALGLIGMFVPIFLGIAGIYWFKLRRGTERGVPRNDR